MAIWGVVNKVQNSYMLNCSILSLWGGGGGGGVFVTRYRRGEIVNKI